jgi:hypothetical protein
MEVANDIRLVDDLGRKRDFRCSPGRQFYFVGRMQKGRERPRTYRPAAKCSELLVRMRAIQVTLKTAIKHPFDIAGSMPS